MNTRNFQQEEVMQFLMGPGERKKKFPAYEGDVSMSKIVTLKKSLGIFI